MVDAIASVIHPNFANTLVRRLNQIAPLEKLRHLKRVHKKFVQGGETQLSVSLRLASQNGNQLDGIQNDVRELMNSYNNIEGITGFSEEDSHSVFSFMKYAIQLANSGDNSVNAAVVVDPSVKQVIAKACDQTCSCYNPKNKITLETSCSGKRETCVCHSNTNGVLSREGHSNGFPDKSEQLYSDVSCLNPWGWAQQESDTSLHYCHPLRHIALLLLNLLLPGTDFFSPVWAKRKISLLKSTACSLLRQALRQKDKAKCTNVNGDDNLDVDSEGCSRSLSARPWLCTGFDMYLVWEPCIFCEMALVHQRIRRIFFAYRNAKAGALGSVH